MAKQSKTSPAHEVSPTADPVSADASTDNFLGRLQGVVTITGDIESPVEPAQAWEVLR